VCTTVEEQNGDRPPRTLPAGGQALRAGAEEGNQSREIRGILGQVKTAEVSLLLCCYQLSLKQG